MNLYSKIVVLGSGGLIGGRIVSTLEQYGYNNVVPCKHSELDLTDQNSTLAFFNKIKPDYVFFCAVKAITDFERGSVGDAEELYCNSMMACNVMKAAYESGVKKAVFLGSAMLYPWNIEPMPERLSEDLLEDFNLKGYSASMQAAVLSKLFLYKMCQYYNKQYGCKFIYCMPAHIYGGFSGRKNLYFTERLVMDICDAKKEDKSQLFVDVFGKGMARKNLLHVDDCADAIITVMNKYEGNQTAVNIASDEVVNWSQVVDIICKTIDYRGNILFNTDREENLTNRLCSTKILDELGWTPKKSIDFGLKELCKEYMEME